MSWAALIAVLLEFFGPFLKQLLDDLFKKATPQLAPTFDAALPAAAIAELFDAAKSQTWRWQLGKRAQLAACKAVALRRAPEFKAALMSGAAVPVMSRAEQEQVASAG